MKIYRNLYILDRVLRWCALGLVAWVLVLLVIFLGGCASTDTPGTRRGCICVFASCDCSLRECAG